MTWHRIDDPDNPAPKDGTVILAYARRLGIELVFWGAQPQHNPHPAWISASCNTNHIDQPTHWQPLPNPPEKERHEREEPSCNKC